jgi:hypothetical protein
LKPAPSEISKLLSRLRALALPLTLSLAWGAPFDSARGETTASAPSALAEQDRLKAKVPRSTLDRPWDLVVVEAAALPPLGGVAFLDRLRVMAFLPEHDWQVIPYQIDERDREGSWILTEKAAREEGADAGVFSSKDQIVFRARDLGLRAARTAWPEDVKAGAEVSVQDPRDGARGWAYLFRFEKPPPSPTIRPIRASGDAAGPGETVTTPSYRVTFPRLGWRRHVPGVMTELAIDGRGAGRHGANLLDRQKTRYRGRYRFPPGWSFRRDESDISGEPIGRIDGVVRMIRQVRRRMHFPAWLDAETEATLIFLPDRIILETPDPIPSRVRRMIHGLDVRISWDFAAPAGSVVHTAPAPGGVSVDGRTEGIETALDGIASVWWALGTPRDGTLLAVFERGERGRGIPARPRHPVLFYRDDAAPDRPEVLRGSSPGIGWRLDGAGARPSRHRPARVHLFVLERFRPGDEGAALDAVNRPLTVTGGPGIP